MHSRRFPSWYTNIFLQWPSVVKILMSVLHVLQDKSSEKDFCSNPDWELRLLYSVFFILCILNSSNGIIYIIRNDLFWNKKIYFVWAQFSLTINNAQHSSIDLFSFDIKKVQRSRIISNPNSFLFYSVFIVFNFYNFRTQKPDLFKIKLK